MSKDFFFHPEKRVFWKLLFIFKLFLALLTRTRYAADENQQGPEVAYNMVYGGGRLTWEWYPEYTLRPVLHPSIYAAFFWILKTTRLDFTFLIIYGPNFLHVLLWIAGDRCFYSVIKNLYGISVAKIALLIY